MDTFMAGICQGGGTGMLTAVAPAKLNLTLEVLGKRPDGFHEIRSVAQTIALHDSFRFDISQNIEFRCDRPDWIASESLVSKAVSLLRETSGCSQGAVIEIDKNIPLTAGLGGDSSGAAATLRGLNKLWGLGLSLVELSDLASRLGSDVPFFLYGGTALIEGRGEIVTPLPPPSRMWVILLVPPVPRMPSKTGRLYASLDIRNYTLGQITESLVASLKSGKGLSMSLFNVFEHVAFDSFPGLEESRQQFLQAGAGEVHLAGSGPSLFTLTDDRPQAEQIYQRLQQEGLESYLTETVTNINLLA
jgi:4-diphosphocytidyl-2-C-methyl-D-erythritol kinase